jgi:hypothetical protein
MPAAKKPAAKPAAAKPEPEAPEPIALSKVTKKDTLRISRAGFTGKVWGSLLRVGAPPAPAEGEVVTAGGAPVGDVLELQTPWGKKPTVVPVSDITGAEVKIGGKGPYLPVEL